MTPEAVAEAGEGQMVQGTQYMAVPTMVVIAAAEGRRRDRRDRRD